MRLISEEFRIIVTLILALCVGGFAQAAVIDFEGLGAEGTVLTNVPGAPEMTVSGGILVIPGEPRTAFNGRSSGGPGGIDDALSGNTLKSESNGSTVVVTFSTNVKDLQFYAVDIEIASVTEVLTARVFDAGDNLLHTITLTGGDPGAGDGLLTLVDFSTGFTGTDTIRRLEFEAITSPSTLPGYAVDNFSYDVAEATDLEPPIIVSVTVAPQEITTVDGAKEVIVEAIAMDVGTGVANIEIFLDDPGSTVDGQGILLSQSFAPAQAEATAAFTAIFPTTASDGIWQLSGQVRDSAGNSTPFNGGANGIPEGVVVDNALCDASAVEYRTGPYTKTKFGAGNSGDFFPSLPEEEIRVIQTEMAEYNGWDAKLREIDYEARRAFCVAKVFEKDARNGADDAITIYSLSKENLVNQVIKELDPRLDYLRNLLGQVEVSLQAPEYNQLMTSIQQADRRDFKRAKDETKGDAKTAKAIWDVIQDIAKYTTKIGAKRLSGFASDLFDVVSDTNTIILILGENIDIESNGKPFMELWLMRIELTILIDQYEKQRVEYDKLNDRLKPLN